MDTSSEHLTEPTSGMPNSESSQQCSWFRKSNVAIVGLVGFVALYLSVGALLFVLIEGRLEKDLWDELFQEKEAFLDHHVQCLTPEQLDAFMKVVLDANNRGISVIGNATSQPNWSFGQAFFFAGTVLTTIGYGHVAPLSEGGKVFCMIYALVGIPLTLIMFSALVERIMIVVNKLLKALTARLGHLWKTFYIRLLHMSLVVSVLVVVIFFVPAAVFMALEPEWNFLDSFYYCFISMTTIGLGDYIPGEQQDQPHRLIYKLCTTFYLFAGLVLMMTILATVYDVQELNIGFHFYLKSDEEEEERLRLRSSTDQLEVGSKYGAEKSVNSQSETPSTSAYAIQEQEVTP